MKRSLFLLIVVIAVVAVAGFWFFSIREQVNEPAAAMKIAASPARPIGQPITIAVPLGLPPVPVPADNPPTAETIALGRRLYYDKQLSADGSVACASCHDPAAGFADPRPVSVGVGQKTGTRNSPTVINSAYYEVQFWDGRAPTLEKQAEGPVANPVEMAHTLAGVEQRLAKDPSYLAEFERAFGAGPITYDKIEKAIASFERTVLSGNSPFDRWYYGGDQKAVSASVKRGFEVFRRADKANCAACHTVGEKYALFTDNKFHNLGVGVFGDEQLKDVGRFEVTRQEKDKGAFKTPTLRNIAQTAPYLHDGSRKTLKEVLDFYVGGGNSNVHRDPLIKPLDHLTGQEQADLLAFLEALNGELPKDVGPPMVEAKK
ncbi:MAG TPA: cytochrome c peroxidase [Terriglobales bacterium]|nr:cytochrome c peroxidase [Terriglobales bacterium]